MAQNLENSQAESADFTLLFEKLSESISNQAIEFTESLNISKETLDTISYFKDFQESIDSSTHVYLTRS